MVRITTWTNINRNKFFTFTLINFINMKKLFLSILNELGIEALTRNCHVVPFFFVFIYIHSLLIDTDFCES